VMMIQGKILPNLVKRWEIKTTQHYFNSKKILLNTIALLEAMIWVIAGGFPPYFANVKVHLHILTTFTTPQFS